MTEPDFIITWIIIVTFLEWLTVTYHLYKIEGLLQDSKKLKEDQK